MKAPTRERLSELIRLFPKTEIVAIGDLFADVFLHGDIERVSREAPVLILKETEQMHVPGGGGNMVMNLVALGCKPKVIGVVGKDHAGDKLKHTLSEAGGKTSGIKRDANYPTPTKMRIVAGGVHTRRQQVVRIDRGATSLSTSTRDQLAKLLARGFESGAGLVIADYGVGAASPTLIRQARKLTRSRPKFTVVDSRDRLLKFPAVTAATPNQEELESSLDKGSLRSDTQIVKGSKQLHQQLKAEALCVTRGSKGMLLVTKERATAIPAFGPDEVADVTGAGDTVTATYSLVLAAGGSHYEAATLANIAAGLVVMKAGTATVSPSELLAAIDDQEER